ncbi:MAG: L,D-transpeptidase family protein [Planktomarina sp.]
MTWALRICVACVVLAIGLVLYTHIMVRVGSGTPPAMAATHTQADLIIVDKSDRRMTLLQNGQEIKSYPISLGGNPTGHKVQEGDNRTPEGRYIIDWRNENSIAHLSLHISYPNADDTAHAQSLGVSPGGNIMIHGILNGWGFIGPMHLLSDWTNGCIAVTDAQMREIWSLVPNGTPIEIRP